MRCLKLSVLAGLLLSGSAVFGQLNSGMLPRAWKITKRISVPGEQLPALGKKLGGEVAAIDNYLIDACGARLQINIVRCKTNEDAAVVYKAFLNLHGTDLTCLRRGVEVFEFRSQSNMVQLIKKARSLFAVDTNIRSYAVELDIAPIDKADYECWNTLFNMLMMYQNGSRDRDLLDTIAVLKKKFNFSRTVPLYSRTLGNEETVYTFTEPVKAVSRGDMILYTFSAVPDRMGIPVLHVGCRIPVKPFSMYDSGLDIDRESLIHPTVYWPARADYIQEIVKQYDTIEEDDKKAEVLLAWVAGNIRFGGDKTGSRYGVDKVIRQGYGHCWDKSDVYITLCRAAGIPARQVAGWLRGVSGHIWSEVYINGKGWLAVDATAGYTGVSDDYIPFFLIENGEMPALYWNIPVIREM